MKRAIRMIDKHHPGIIHGEIKDYLLIHSKKKSHIPTGFPILQTTHGMMKTFYTDEQVVYSSSKENSKK